MVVLKSKLFWLSALALVLSGGLLVVVLGYAALVAYSAITTGAPIVGTLLQLAVPYLLIVAALVATGVLSVAGMLWALVRNASVPRSERLETLAERVEREYPVLRSVGLSEFFAPPEPSEEEKAERALDRLKRRYVDGELTEAEFERKVDNLVANDSVDEARAARERREVLEEESTDRY